MAPDIHALIKEPFGPYPQGEILRDDWPRTSRDLPSLASLYLSCSGDAIGLDETEWIYPPPPTVRFVCHPVLFFGVLEIKSLSWLSEQGHEWLQEDLRKRDVDMHMDHRPASESGLTLSSLYGHREGEGLGIKVYIQGEKKMNILFLQRKQPRTLMLHAAPYDHKTETRQIHRVYEVISLDVETFKLSQNFFLRYRLLGLMEDIIATDPEKTPLEDRDINYFVNQYINRYRHEHLSLEKTQRYIFNPDQDPGVDKEGNTTEPRHLRHLHRSEIIGIFASQATWILAQQLKQKPPLVNTVTWYRFCRQVIIARKDARQNGNRQWGRLSSDTEDEDEVDLDKYWVPKNLLKNLHQQPKPVASASRPTSELPSDQSTPSTDDQMDYDQRLMYDYDSDFSEPSTPECSENTDAETTDLEKYKLISHPEYLPPQLPKGSFKWHCPVLDCTYTIDLLDLTDKDTRDLPRAYAEWLRSRRWRLKDRHIQLALQLMVSSHYDDHNTERGIRWVPDPTNPQENKLVRIHLEQGEEHKLNLARQEPSKSLRLQRGNALPRSVVHNLKLSARRSLRVPRTPRPGSSQRASPRPNLHLSHN